MPIAAIKLILVLKLFILVRLPFYYVSLNNFRKNEKMGKYSARTQRVKLEIVLRKQQAAFKRSRWRELVISENLVLRRFGKTRFSMEEEDVVAGYDVGIPPW